MLRFKGESSENNTFLIYDISWLIKAAGEVEGSVSKEMQRFFFVTSWESQISQIDSNLQRQLNDWHH